MLFSIRVWYRNIVSRYVALESFQMATESNKWSSSFDLVANDERNRLLRIKNKH